MTIEVGMRFKKNKTGEIVEVVKTDDVLKTCIVKNAEGKTTVYSNTTIKDKRNWTFCEEPECEELIVAQNEDSDQAEDVIVEDDLTSTPDIEKLEDLKKEATGKIQTGTGFDIKDFIIKTAEDLGYEICPSKCRFISFKINGKMKAGLFSYGKKSCTLGVRSKCVEETGIEPSSIMKHSIDYRYKFESFDEDSKQNIVNLLKASL